MGIYDRNYYQEDERRAAWTGGRSMVVNLILLNVVIWVANLLMDNRLNGWLSLKSDLFTHPWQAWQLVTYGFLHEFNDVRHILGNMFFLWLFGTDVEGVYGRAEFLRVYLVTIVLAGLVWAGVAAVQGGGPPLIGASGGVMGLMILFVMNFPRRTIYIWGLLPVPVWALGSFYVLMDLSGAMSNDPSDYVAHSAHLTGVVFGFVYYRAGLNLGRLVPRRLSWPSLRPKLRIHEPENESSNLNEQVDKILAKISQTGESSLTKQERRTLEKASRHYQRRRE